MQQQMTNDHECDDIPSLLVADSKFLGFAKIIDTPSEAIEFQNTLKRRYPAAAHVPLCWVFVSEEGGYRERNDDQGDAGEGGPNGNARVGFDEDGEPFSSCGTFILNETMTHFDKYMRNEICNRTDSNSNSTATSKGLVLAIVRFFGYRLLGVSCGRLSQCYHSIATLTLHRFFHGKDVQLQQHFVDAPIDTSKYGLGAGDCEVILNVVSDIDGSDDKASFLQQIVNELNFDGFKGNQGETLPRLQNLQCTTMNGAIPVYRYPGNYTPDQWETFQFSKTSLQVKEAVEKNLKPLYPQEMNHCVSNYYRDGNDFIDHHSDKDLDLDREGVIVSVSIGAERILELKRRSLPKDITRIRLPHGSMLILGPMTNKLFTHSILKAEGSTIPRLSLTFRHVVTFMDLKTKRLFGGGVKASTKKEMRNRQRLENAAFFVGFAGLALLLSNKHERTQHKQKFMKSYLPTIGLFTGSFFSFRKLSAKLNRDNEERQARDFFSRTSIHGTKY